MKLSLITAIILSIFLLSCNSSSHTTSDQNVAPDFQNRGHELVYNMVQKAGDYNKLVQHEDVVYTYNYQMPDGKTDEITEKYIFDGELSYGIYHQNDRTFPDLSGQIEQGYDGSEFWLKHNGEVVNDEKKLKRVAFSRPTNFYWFTMIQKLLDPSLKYEYIGEETLNDLKYNVVKVSFDLKDGKPSDIYQLYINKNTSLMDQFLFTVADFGKMETPNLMVLEYEEIDGMLLPTKRKYKKSTWNADVNEDPWINVNWSNIKFNNDLSKDDFKKENKMKNDAVTSLKSVLDDKKANFEKKASEQKKKAYKAGLVSVEKSGIVSSAKQVGAKAPNFTLTNALGKPVELNEYLKKGKVILTWYRGGWCPYCNLTLHQLQQELPNFKLNGANLLALTPELPDKSITTAEKHDLEFEVLSDIGNKVAREYGIVFKLTDEVAGMYNNSFDMNSYNGDKSNELPLAATYIINKKGEIEYAFLDADYRNRAEPSEITEFLKNY